MRTRPPVIGSLLLFAACLVSIASAQTNWTRTYGGQNDDAGYSVQQTSDGGYIIAGYTYSYGVGGRDVYLIRTDAEGDTLWTRTYGGLERDEGFSVQQTIDGGYIVAGSTWSFGTGAPEFSNVYLVRTNAHGDTLWTRTYGGESDDDAHSVAQTADGGFIVAGTHSFGAGAEDVWLLRTNVLGDTVSTRTYGGPLWDRGRAVQPTADGGYIVAGSTREDYGVYLVKTDSHGDTLWTRIYGDKLSAEGEAVQQTTDGGYIVTGRKGGSRLEVVLTENKDELWVAALWVESAAAHQIVTNYYLAAAVDVPQSEAI